jgi:uridine phosphorylase
MPPPILRKKRYRDPSQFLPENLLREARRQKNIPDGAIPEVCILDPDGDIVRHLLSSGRAVRNPNWPCYHTSLFNFTSRGCEYGIVGYAVGAAFAVLIAEELFASGCRLLFSVTSAGQITPVAQDPPFFVLIERALRDEGTSYHYLPPSDYASMNKDLLKAVQNAPLLPSSRVVSGSSWTTDAPFRETEDAINYARSQNIIAVEMEAAALYAFAQAKQKPVICIAHVTNQMGVEEGDFEKGEEGGSREALGLIT